MRTLSNIPTSNDGSWPPEGPHLCRCIKTGSWTSPKKGTAAAKLTFTTADAQYQFEDLVFVTVKAMGRLALVASRLCQMPKDTELPDDDLETAKQIARYIVDHAVGKDVILTIETQKEQYMIESGPDMGNVRHKIRSRVAFSGYDVPETEGEQELPETPEDSSDIPF